MLRRGKLPYQRQLLRRFCGKRLTHITQTAQVEHGADILKSLAPHRREYLCRILDYLRTQLGSVSLG